MSKESSGFDNYTPNERKSSEEELNPLSVAHDARIHAIEALKKGAQDEKMPVGERIKRVDSLIVLLREESMQTKSPILAKIDIAEAETYRDQLLHDSFNHSDTNQERRETF